MLTREIDLICIRGNKKENNAYVMLPLIQILFNEFINGHTINKCTSYITLSTEPSCAIYPFSLPL